MHDDTEEKVAESVFVAFCFVPCLFAGWRDVRISGNDAAYRCFKGGSIGRNERKQRKGNGRRRDICRGGNERRTDNHTCTDRWEDRDARETAQETGDHTTEAQGTDSRATEAAAAFDITFLTADGTRVQPGNGKTVSVSFSVAAGSALTAGEQEMASLEVYHIGENDMATLVKSVPAPDSSTSSDISIEADSFSVYMLLKKTDD